MKKQKNNLGKLHVLKIDDSYIDNILNGSKVSEIRYNDRDYQKGDVIKFVRSTSIIDSVLDALNYGSLDTRLDNILFEITHVLNYPKGLKTGYVVLSIKRLKGV